MVVTPPQLASCHCFCCSHQLIVNFKLNFYFGIAIAITHYVAVSTQIQSVLLILQFSCCCFLNFLNYEVIGTFSIPCVLMPPVLLLAMLLCISSLS